MNKAFYGDLFDRELFDSIQETAFKDERHENGQLLEDSLGTLLSQKDYDLIRSSGKEVDRELKTGPIWTPPNCEKKESIKKDDLLER